MAVKLKRPVTRETGFSYQGRPVLVRLEQGGRIVRFKQKGLRSWHVCTVEQLFWIAVANTTAEQKAAKKKLREERRKAKAMA